MVNCLKSLYIIVLDGKSLTIYALFSLLYQHCNAFWYCHATDLVLIVLMLMQQLIDVDQAEYRNLLMQIALFTTFK